VLILAVNAKAGVGIEVVALVRLGIMGATVNARVIVKCCG
jgi:hypothetical protein